MKMQKFEPLKYPDLSLTSVPISLLLAQPFKKVPRQVFNMLEDIKTIDCKMSLKVHMLCVH